MCLRYGVTCLCGLLWLRFQRVVLQVRKLTSAADSCLPLMFPGSAGSSHDFLKRSRIFQLLSAHSHSLYTLVLPSVLEYSQIIRKRKLLLWRVGGSITSGGRFPLTLSDSSFFFLLSSLLPSLWSTFLSLQLLFFPPHPPVFLFIYLFLSFIPGTQNKFSFIFSHYIFILTSVLHPWRIITSTWFFFISILCSCARIN